MGRKSRSVSSSFWCQYREHPVSRSERVEQNGVFLCADCCAHWQQREAELDAADADIALIASAPANDTAADSFAGVAVDEMIRDLAYAAAVLRVEVPEGFDGWSATTLTVRDAEAFIAGARRVFLACFRGYQGQGLHDRASGLVTVVSDGMREIRRWVDAQGAERVAVAS